MKKNKIILALALLLSVTSLAGCNNSTGSGSESEEFSDIEYVDVDKEKAKEVEALIDALSDTATEEEVNAVFEKYNDLTDRQKEYVSNYSVLEGHVIRIERTKAIAKVVELINALDESDPNSDAVFQARKAYNAIGEKYGTEYLSEVPAESLAKLIRCEGKVASKVVTPLLTKALSLDLDSNDGSSQFVLLSNRIDDLCKDYTTDILDSLELYDDYVEAKKVNGNIYSIATSKFYTTTSGAPYEKWCSEIPTTTDDNFGYITEEDFTGYNISGSGNIQLAAKADFSAYKAISFFVSWPKANVRLDIINNGGLVTFVNIAEANKFYYVEIPVSSLKDPTGNDFTHLGAYLADKTTGMHDGYKVTPIIGIGLHTRKAQAAVDAVNALIESLDLSNLDVDKVYAAREAYENLAKDYSEEWQAKVSAENIAKLNSALEILPVLVVNKLIASANALDLVEKHQLARFAIIAQNVKEKYTALSTSDKEKVVGYDELLTKEITVNKTTNVIYTGNQAFGIGGTSDPLTEKESLQFGKVNSFRFPSGNAASLQLEPQSLIDNWSNNLSFGFFASYDVENSENFILVGNGDWGKTVYASKVLVDASTHTYFYEFNLASINVELTLKTFIQVYFSQSVTSFECSNFVSFNPNVDEINALIAEANSINTSINSGITRFALLSKNIDSKVATLNGNTSALVGYDTYYATRATVGAKAIVAYDTEITTDHNGDWPALEKVADSKYAEFNTFRYATPKTNTINLFVIANGKNWSKYTKVAVFIQFSQAQEEKVFFVAKNDWSLTFNASYQVYDATKNIYYVELDVTDITAKFTGNPFFCCYLSQPTTFISITNVVTFK